MDEMDEWMRDADNAVRADCANWFHSVSWRAAYQSVVPRTCQERVEDIERYLFWLDVGDDTNGNDAYRGVEGRP